MTFKVTMKKPTACGQCPFYVKYSARSQGDFDDYAKCTLGYINCMADYDWLKTRLFEGCRLGSDPKSGVDIVED